MRPQCLGRAVLPRGEKHQHSEAREHQNELHDIGANVGGKAAENHEGDRDCGCDKKRGKRPQMEQKLKQRAQHQHVRRGRNHQKQQPRAHKRDRFALMRGLQFVGDGQVRGVAAPGPLKTARTRRRTDNTGKPKTAHVPKPFVYDSSPTPKMPPYHVATRVATKAGSVRVRPRDHERFARFRGSFTGERGPNADTDQHEKVRADQYIIGRREGDIWQCGRQNRLAYFAASSGATALWNCA